jgi:hypothetical protein
MKKFLPIAIIFVILVLVAVFLVNSNNPFDNAPQNDIKVLNNTILNDIYSVQRFQRKNGKTTDYIVPEIDKAARSLNTVLYADDLKIVNERTGEDVLSTFFVYDENFEQISVSNTLTIPKEKGTYYVGFDEVFEKVNEARGYAFYLKVVVN